MPEPPPPPTHFRGPIPRLDTLHRIETILREAARAGEPPLPLAEIKRRMPTKSIRHTTVRACVNELIRLGLIEETPGAGAMWAHPTSRPDTGPAATRARLHKHYRMARDLKDVAPGKTIEAGLQLMELGAALHKAVDHV